jgi:phosphate starvation-inducible PhoH-like protein
MGCVHKNDITFVFGPAGTGKTHVAVGLAVRGLRGGVFDRLILTRPLVEVGKSMGYLPGGIEEKVGPYVRPCFDELRYYLNYNEITSYVNDGTIEIVPPSMMRGRTFARCLILLDEAQNAIKPEVKSLLTRLGEGSRMILAGDPQQSDLPESEQGAFQQAAEDLDGLEGIGIIRMNNGDIVRHPLLSEILERLR